MQLLKHTELYTHKAFSACKLYNKSDFLKFPKEMFILVLNEESFIKETVGSF